MTFYLLLLTMMLPYQVSQKRILTLYTPDTGNVLYLKQKRWLDADKAGLQERDLVVQTHVYSDKTLPFYKKNRVKKGFTITLTGKDGGEKLRSSQPVTLSKLYALIDSMPMRQQEMKP